MGGGDGSTAGAVATSDTAGVEIVEFVIGEVGDVVAEAVIDVNAELTGGCNGEAVDADGVVGAVVEGVVDVDASSDNCAGNS